MKNIEITCPLSATMAVIGGKWKVVILWYLKDGPLRFKDLHEKLPECSLKVYNDTLKDLMLNQVVSKKVYPEVPPRVEYYITEYGQSLLPIVTEIRNWGVQRLVTHPTLMENNSALQGMIKSIVEKENLH